MMPPMAASLIGPIDSSLIQPAASSLINAITGKGRKGGLLQLSTLSLMIKAMSEKWVTRAKKGVMRGGSG